MGQDSPTQPAPGVGIQGLSTPHQIVDARSPESVPVRLDGAVAGHVLVKNTNNALPLDKPLWLSIYGYDAALPPSKDVDFAFSFGTESVAGQGLIGPVGLPVYPPTAIGGTIISGGGSGASSPDYIYAVGPLYPSMIFFYTLTRLAIRCHSNASTPR